MRGDRLCGYVMASYDCSPYVHMITAQKAMEDIAAVTGVSAKDVNVYLAP